jgi:hypothetical protein
MGDPLPPDINSEQASLLDGASYAQRLQYFHDEANAALARSDTFLIKWSAKDVKIVPPHWKVNTKRESPLSSNVLFIL